MNPKYYIRINGYDIRKFNYSEYCKRRKEIDMNNSPVTLGFYYYYCITNGKEDIHIADSNGDGAIIFDIHSEIESGTPYSDIKQRIDLIVDIGNAVMETLNKRK